MRALLGGLVVEEAREPRQRLAVVVDGRGDVLLLGRELASDLGVQLGYETLGRNGVLLVTTRSGP